MKAERLLEELEIGKITRVDQFNRLFKDLKLDPVCETCVDLEKKLKDKIGTLSEAEVVVSLQMVMNWMRTQINVHITLLHEPGCTCTDFGGDY